ncbi:MAG: hypothetical protein V7784_20440 [Oceanospirillaceae bacterium]
MPLTKIPHFIVIHGVQTGTDDDIESDLQIKKLLQKQLDNIDLQVDFEVIGVTYEDINDEAQRPYQWLLETLVRSTPLTSLLLSRIADVVGDVYSASKGTKTANKIRAKIKKRILKSFNAGHPVYLIAHSLGTVYCLDVLCELMQESDYFTHNSLDCWPVHSFISMGSPLGLTTIFKQREIPPIRQPLAFPFSWHNFHHPLDPVVSGNAFGAPTKYKGAIGPVESTYKETAKHAHWSIEGHRTVQSAQWLIAHISYWQEPIIGDTLIDIAWG